MGSGGIPDGWAIATNAARGTFDVADRKFARRGLTETQRQEMLETRPTWENDKEFIVWALERLRQSTDKKDVTRKWLDDNLDDDECIELTQRLLVQLKFRAAGAPDAPATP